MKRIIVSALTMCCLLVCTARTWTQQQKNRKPQLKRREPASSYKTAPSQEALTQQLKTLEAKLARLQAKASKLETSSRQTVTALEKKVVRLGAGPTSRPMISSETRGDVVGFAREGNKYTLAVNGAKIEIDAAGNLLFQAAGQITMESAAVLHAKATMIKLGNAPKRPVASLQDLVLGNTVAETSCKNVFVD